MKNFTLSLYAFHLRHKLTDAPDKVTENAQNLWDNLINLYNKSLNFPKLKDLRSYLICYDKIKDKNEYEYNPEQEKGRQTYWLSKGILDLGNINTTEGFAIKANLQPFLIHDTYAVDLTLSPKSEEIPIDVNQLKLFHPESLLPKSIDASLGQTVWIYGEVEKSDEECAVLAEGYATALLAGSNLEFGEVRQEKLLGCLLFEYQATDLNNPDNPAKQYHILISINNTKAEAAKFSEAYDLLIYLLAYRHKILYIYQEACHCNPKARKYYSKLNDDMLKFPEQIVSREKRLDNFRHSLEKMPLQEIHYSLCLRDLKAHYTSIATNIVNYRNCLDKIATIGEYPESWDNFVDLKCNQWKQQIQIDIDFLSPGQELFGQMIQTIRGIVAIDQAESDRTKARVEKDRNRIFGILGFGFAPTSLILSALSLPHIEVVEAIEEIPPLKGWLQPLNPQLGKKDLADSVVALSFGILLAVFFGGVAALIYKISDSWQPKEEAGSKNNPS